MIKYFNNFAVFCGNGAMALHTSKRGGAGAITGDANITAKLLSFIIHNFKREKEIDNFNDLQILIENILKLSLKDLIKIKIISCKMKLIIL